MTKKSKQLFMGVDIGISSIKAAVFDPDGNQLGFHKIEISLICNLTGMAELGPEVIFRSFLDVVKKCIRESKICPDELEAIGLSSQMHSLLAIDGLGNCLTNIITWADTRAKNQADFIKEKFDYKKMSFNTGCRIYAENNMNMKRNYLI